MGPNLGSSVNIVGVEEASGVGRGVGPYVGSVVTKVGFDVGLEDGEEVGLDEIGSP